MNIILISKNRGSHSLDFTPRMFWVISGLVVLFFVSVLLMGTWVGYALKSHATDVSTLNSQKDIQVLQQQSEEYVNVLAARVAQLQARIIRLDALGDRLAKGAKLDDGEFDFTSAPSQGGPETDEGLGENLSVVELQDMVSKLDKRIEDREQQLSILDGFIANKQLASNQYLTGLPVQGSITSEFGYRIHPITGRRALHSGLDIGAKFHSDILAPASGIVTFSGWRGGYGRMVEIDHGNGLVTRYAHNSMNIVNVGDAVTKNDVIAYVGTSGRSTGPHVHFEVLKDGEAVNPLDYMMSSHTF